MKTGNAVIIRHNSLYEIKISLDMLCTSCTSKSLFEFNDSKISGILSKKISGGVPAENHSLKNRKLIHFILKMSNDTYISLNHQYSGFTYVS